MVDRQLIEFQLIESRVGQIQPDQDPYTKKLAEFLRLA